MNHAITVGGLLLSVGAFAGAGAGAFGLLMLAAASMSDAPDDGTGGKGCAVSLIGLAVFGLCILGLFF